MDGTQNKKKRRLSYLIRAAVSAGLIAFLVLRIDIGTLFETLKSADLRLFFTAIFFSFLKQATEFSKLFLLLRAKGFNVPFWHVAKIMITSTFLGTFAPTSLGTEVFRAYGFSKYTNQSAHSVSAVAVNRFLSLFALLFLATVSSVFEKEYAANIGALWLAVIFLLPLLLIGMGFVKGIQQFFQKYIFPKVPIVHKTVHWLTEAGKSFYDYRKQKLLILTVFLLSIVFQVARIIVCYLLALAIGVQLPIGFFFIFIPLVLLFTMIPLSVGGIGMREGGVVYFLGKAGISGAVAFSVSILWFIAAITSSLPGLYFYLSEGIGLKKKDNIQTEKDGF